MNSTEPPRIVEYPRPSDHPEAWTPDPLLARRIHGSASWLYWVAGLTAVSSVSTMIGHPIQFATALGVTMMFTYFMRGLGGAGIGIGLAFDFVAVGILAGLGFYAYKFQRWAFLAGMIVLGLDTLILLPFISEMPVSVAFHAWAIFSLWSGYKLIPKA